MQSFIISSKDLGSGILEARKESEKQKAGKFDIEVSEFEKALGIEDIRNIQKKIFLKPFKGEKKSLIIVLRNGATIEAQNSMLKLLEEPPPSSLIFLVTDNAMTLLPTILSRCKLIELNKETTLSENKGEYSDFLKNLRMETGEALKMAQDLSKDKSGAIRFLERRILTAREEMLGNLADKQKSLRFRKMIHKLELTHYDLKNTNVNPRLALENLFLTLNSKH